MKKLMILLITSLALVSSGARAEEGMTTAQKVALQHANPMPNLIKVVGDNQEALKLTNKQKKALAQWVDNNEPRMMNMVQTVIKLEKKLHDASLAGAPGSVLKNIATQMLNVRGAIIKQKTACRNYLARVLGKEQMKQAIALYKKSA